MEKIVRIECQGATTAELDQLLPFQGDLKTLSRENYHKLRDEIIRDGFSEPISVWRHMFRTPADLNIGERETIVELYVLNGHQRLKTLEWMRDEEGYIVPPIPISLVDAPDRQAAKRKVLALTSQYGEMTKESLVEFMKESGLTFQDVSSTMRFPEVGLKEIQMAFNVAPDSGGGPGGPPATDDAPESSVIPKCNPGDLWRLGDHIMICGDSTDPAEVKRLMGDELADMVFTDPPYGVSYQTDMTPEEAEARNRRTDGLEVKNDDLTPERLLEFLKKAITAWPLKPGGTYYLCSPAGSLETIFRLSLGGDHELRQCIVWVKNQFVMGRQDYHWRHESILYGWRAGSAHYFVADRTQDTVWEFDRPKRSPEHPTMKPVDLVKKAIANSSVAQQIVFDGFGGSGTSLVAAEELGRRARVMELDPRYADVILERWAKMTGKDPVREDGMLWSSLSK